MLDVPSRETIATDFLDAYRTAFAHRMNVSRGSDAWRLSRVVSAVAWSIAAVLLFVVQQMLPDSASGVWLQRWARLFGLPFRGPAAASGVSVLEVTGTPGSSVPQGTALAHVDGTQYQVVTVGAVVGGGGTVAVSIEALTLGTVGNKLAGDELVFANPPAGVQAVATLIGDLGNGADQEQDDEYRPRLQDHLASPPEGGAVHDYVKWAKQVPGVVQVFVYRFRRGLGTIDLAVLGAGAGAARIIATTQPVADYIEARRPAFAPDHRLLTVQAQTQDVACAIEIDSTRFRWDFLDDGVGYLVTASTPAQNKITCTGVPLTCVVGVRITVRGEQFTVTARSGGVLTLSGWPTVSPIGARIRAGGDLVIPVQTAIRTLFNALGPTRGRYAATTWSDGLKVAKILAAATDVAGVVDAEVTTPASNVAQADDYSSTVKLLVPGHIEVVRL